MSLVGYDDEASEAVIDTTESLKDGVIDDVDDKEKKKKKKKKEKKKEKKEKKKKLVMLPSASDLLSEIPTNLLGRPENVILSGDEAEDAPGRVDKKGTSYNAVAPPGNLAQISKDEAFKLRPALPDFRADQKKRDADIEKKQKREERTSSFAGFKPRQVGGKANVSVEDLEGMGIKRAQKRVKNDEQ